MKTYLFLDLETSGLEPELDRIVEIGWLFAEQKLDRITKTQHTPVKPVGSALSRIYGNDVVYAMHSSTGLLNELLSNADLPLLATVEDRIVEEIEHIEAAYEEFLSTLSFEERMNSEKMEFQLGGKNVHFDKSFVDRYMPRLAKKLSHRTFDESTVKSIFDAIDIQFDIVSAYMHGDGDQEFTRHRAGYDVEVSYVSCQFAVKQLEKFLRTAHPEEFAEMFILDGNGNQRND